MSLLCKGGLDLFESNEVGVKYEFILGLKELLLKSISKRNTNKKEKANKQTKKKEKAKPIIY